MTHSIIVSELHGKTTGELMKLLRLLSIAAIMLCGAAYTFAQQPACEQKRPQEFNGFQIGMTLMDVKDMLEDSSVFDRKLADVNKIGAQAIEILGTELKEKYAEAVESVNLTFVDKIGRASCRERV